jgi:ABC-type transporter lipoprotein component MlaA
MGANCAGDVKRVEQTNRPFYAINTGVDRVILRPASLA